MVQNGGYPQWFDDVPKGMSRKKYLRLKKSKPKNKSMKIWIKENTKRRKRTRKRKVQKGGFAPCLPCLAPAVFASAAIGGAGFMMKSSSSSISSSSISSSRNGKNKTKKISRKSYVDSRGRNNEESQISIDDYDKDIERKGKKIYIDDKLYKSYGSINKAQKDFNKLIRKQKLLLKDE